MPCLNCLQPVIRKNYKYCSNKCQTHYQYKKFIKNWKSGVIDGNKGVAFPQLSNHIKRYLLEKFGEQCCLCGWNQRHSVTQKVPLEVNHLDGNSFNNAEDNYAIALSELPFAYRKLPQSQQGQRSDASSKNQIIGSIIFKSEFL